ncbi:circadian clock protein KaiC [Alienimonas californiensis]|uniref:Circadian clock protein kinase KaiC n=1 Tax=Alienimonas californiensis TaxID=2527989 RepID=A0A517P713_9PLAN|nr:circadian clock protein KaiC [Alienimonas californiensis]QDT15142.1 Circadian clock protein kinase KaiC [Alienimonas californiensis]
MSHALPSDARPAGEDASAAQDAAGRDEDAGRHAGLPRLATGLEGLDHVLMGGLPRGRTTMVLGSSGSGKTLLVSQFLWNAVRRGEPAVLVTFEEQAQELIRNVGTLGWDLGAAAEAGTLQLVDASPDPHAQTPIGDYDLSGIILQVQAAVQQCGAKLVALDSLGGLFTQFEDHGALRREIVRLRDLLREMGCTTVITAERLHEDGPVSRHGIEDFVADCVLILRQTLSNERLRRTVQVHKLRGDRHRHGEYPFIIAAGGEAAPPGGLHNGIVVLPMSTERLSQGSVADRTPFGNAGLDRMTGGGLFQDSVVLISGPTGGGKTLLASTFAAHGCRTGDRSLFLSFEESRAQLVRHAANWSHDFAHWEEQGLLKIRCEYPENRGLEGHLYEIQRQIELFEPQRLVVDSVSALARIGTPRAFREFLIALSSHLKRKRVCGLLTVTSSHIVSRSEKVGVHISTLTDAIILLRYLEQDNEIGRSVSVVKMRGSQHDKHVRQFTIDDAGAHVGEPVHETSAVIGNILP